MGASYSYAPAPCRPMDMKNCKLCHRMDNFIKNNPKYRCDSFCGSEKQCNKYNLYHYFSVVEKQKDFAESQFLKKCLFHSLKDKETIAYVKDLFKNDEKYTNIIIKTLENANEESIEDDDNAKYFNEQKKTIISRGYRQDTPSASIDYVYRQKHMLYHVVSSPAPDYGDGLFVIDIDSAYWRTEIENDYMTSEINEFLQNYKMESRINKECVFFVSDIYHLVGTVFNDILFYDEKNHADVLQKVTVNATSVQKLYWVVRQYEINTIRKFNMKSLIDFSDLFKYTPYVISSYVFKRAWRNQSVIISAPYHVAGIKNSILKSGSVSPLATLYKTKKVPKNIELTYSVEILKKVDLSYIKFDPVKNTVAFLLQKIIQDNNLPRNHVAYKNIYNYAIDKNNFSIDAILSSIVSLNTVYHPVSANELENRLSDLIRSCLLTTSTKVQLANSGISNLNYIFYLVEETDLFPNDSKGIVFTNAYYEISKAITLKSRQNKSNRYVNLSDKSDYDNFLQERHLKICVLFMDLSWGCTTGVKEYFYIDNVSIIEKLINDGSLVKGCIVALDITIDSIFGKRVFDFYFKLKKYIISKTINLVLYSSMQKLFQYGLDRLSGGFSSWFSNDNRLISALENPKMQKVRLSDIVSTGYSLFIDPKIINNMKEYVNSVHNNNSYLMQLLKKSCHKMIPVIDKNAKIVNVDFVSDNVSTDTYQDKLDNLINSLPTQYIDWRSSWGFRHTVVAPIDRDRIRLCVGASVTNQEIKDLESCICKFF